jgi:hypothetical protein
MAATPHSAPTKTILKPSSFSGEKFMHPTNLKKIITTVTLTAIAAGSLWNSNAAWAQRQAPSRADTRDERRQQTENMTPEQRREYYQGRIQERLKNMTPEQRQRFESFRAQLGEMQRQQQIASVSGEDRQKFLMQSAGIEDSETQNAIIEFVMEQARRRQPVIEAASKLSELLADKTTSNEVLATQQETLTAASKAFRSWKEIALKELDAKVKFSENARLKSLLILVGIIGDEAGDAGGFNAIFPKGLAGGGDITTMLPPMQDPISAMMGGNRGAAPAAN